MKRTAKSRVPNTRSAGGDVNSLIDTLVRQKIQDALVGSGSSIEGAASASASHQQTYSSPSRQKKRLASERRDETDDSDEEKEEVPRPKKQSLHAKTSTEATLSRRPSVSTKKSREASAFMTPSRPKNGDYASQAVLLDGVKDEIKNHPMRLSKAFAAAKSEVQIKGLRKTASGAVLVLPKDPKDCNVLLKEGATWGPLGDAVKARLPKSQTVTHQVVIKGVDIEVTMEEIEEVLKLQKLPYKAVKRIPSREREKPTEMVRLILTQEDEKKRLLKQGIYLDQVHFKCVPAKEDTQNFPKVLQCFNCQKIGDHLASECKNELKCVLCSGPHRKADCKAEKAEYKCANCNQNHASWSAECKLIQTARKAKEKPSMAQIALATVTPVLLSATIETIVDSIKESIALIVSEVVSRCLCELTIDFVGGKLSKNNLPMKVDKVAKDSASATNNYMKCIGTQGKLVQVDLVQQTTRGKCFPNLGSNLTTPSASQIHNGF
jgi:hypothetical protein